MEGGFVFRTFIAATVLAMTTGGSIAATVLKTEPPMGALKEGQRVLVDDGSCPPGQLREVIGGNHTKAGGKSNVIRQYRCVPR
jgi:uncharacterized protein DUF6719